MLAGNQLGSFADIIWAWSPVWGWLAVGWYSTASVGWLFCFECLSFFFRLAWAWPYDNGRGASEQEETCRPLGASLRLAHYPFYLVILVKVSHVVYEMYSAFMRKTPILKWQGGVKMGGHQCNQSSTAWERRNPGEKNIPYLGAPHQWVDLVERTFINNWDAWAGCASCVWLESILIGQCRCCSGIWTFWISSLSISSTYQILEVFNSQRFLLSILFWP